MAKVVNEWPTERQIVVGSGAWTPAHSMRIGPTEYGSSSAPIKARASIDDAESVRTLATRCRHATGKPSAPTAASTRWTTAGR